MNPHLRSYDYVASLAQAEANSTKEDQAIYKTKDEKRYEIFQFIPAYRYKGTAVGIIRYTGNDFDKDVLQDSGVGQPDIVSKATGEPKRKSRRKAE